MRSSELEKVVHILPALEVDGNLDGRLLALIYALDELQLIIGWRYYGSGCTITHGDTS
jgi:hypothetical protein